MSHILNQTLLVFAVALASTLIACGDDSESDTNQLNNSAGSGGTAGAAGSSTAGSAGSSASAGASAAGSGGISGTSGTGGFAGVAGSGGASGSAGNSGGSGVGGIAGTAGTGGNAGTSGNAGTGGFAGFGGTSGAASFACSSLAKSGDPIMAVADPSLYETHPMFARVGDLDSEVVLVAGRAFVESPGPVPGRTSHLHFSGWTENWPISMGEWVDDSDIGAAIAATGYLRNGTFPLAYIAEMSALPNQYGAYFVPEMPIESTLGNISLGYAASNDTLATLRPVDDSFAFALFSENPQPGEYHARGIWWGLDAPLEHNEVVACANSYMLGSAVESSQGSILFATSTSMSPGDCAANVNPLDVPNAIQVLRTDVTGQVISAYYNGDSSGQQMDFVRLVPRSDGAWLFYRRGTLSGTGFTVQQLDLDGNAVGDAFALLDDLVVYGAPGIDRMGDGFAVLFIDDTGQIPKLRLRVYDPQAMPAAEILVNNGTSAGYLDLVASLNGQHLIAGWTTQDINGRQAVTATRFSCINTQ